MEKQKKIWEIILMPLVVAAVGILGTFFITKQQIKSTELLSLSQLESTQNITKSDQQIKIIEIFSAKITSKDVREREIAVRILSALDSVLAKKLITAIAENKSEDTSIRTIAREIIDNGFSSANAYPVIGSYKTFQEAVNMANNILQKNRNIPYPLHIYIAVNGFYALCLGGKLDPQEAKRRVDYAISNGIASDAYVRISDEWRENLLKNP